MAGSHGKIVRARVLTMNHSEWTSFWVAVADGKVPQKDVGLKLTEHIRGTGGRIMDGAEKCSLTAKVYVDWLNFFGFRKMAADLRAAEKKARKSTERGWHPILGGHAPGVRPTTLGGVARRRIAKDPKAYDAMLKECAEGAPKRPAVELPAYKVPKTALKTYPGESAPDAELKPYEPAARLPPGRKKKPLR
jgi:hypothetical protein